MESAEFDALYEESFDRLVGHLTVMTGDAAEAQDCVQEAFIRAWDHRRALDCARSPEAWVRTVAWRLAVSRWRRVRRALIPADRALTATGPPQPDVVHTALVTALRQLSPEQRRAIVLHHLCDLSVAEVAEETGVAAGTVKARLFRGRAALAALLADDSDRSPSRQEPRNV